MCISTICFPPAAQATTAYDRECEALEGLKQALQATRKARRPPDFLPMSPGALLTGACSRDKAAGRCPAGLGTSDVSRAYTRIDSSGAKRMRAHHLFQCTGTGLARLPNSTESDDQSPGRHREEVWRRLVPELQHKLAYIREHSCQEQGPQELCRQCHPSIMLSFVLAALERQVVSMGLTGDAWM